MSNFIDWDSIAKSNRQKVDELKKKSVPFGGTSPNEVCPKCNNPIKEGEFTTMHSTGGAEAHVNCPPAAPKI